MPELGIVAATTSCKTDWTSGRIVSAQDKHPARQTSCKPHSRHAHGAIQKVGSEALNLRAHERYISIVSPR